MEFFPFLYYAIYCVQVLCVRCDGESNNKIAAVKTTHEVVCRRCSHRRRSSSIGRPFAAEWISTPPPGRLWAVTGRSTPFFRFAPPPFRRLTIATSPPAKEIGRQRPRSRSFAAAAAAASVRTAIRSHRCSRSLLPRALQSHSKGCAHRTYLEKS